MYPSALGNLKKLRKGLYYNRNTEAAAVPGASLPVLLRLKENKQKVNTAERAQRKSNEHTEV